MPRPVSLSPTALTLQFQTQGFMTAQGLAGTLRVDRSTVSRALSGLGDEVLRIGAARQARYGLRRNVGTVGRRWPIYRLDEAGRAHDFGVLHSAHRGWWMESVNWPEWLERNYPQGIFPGLPFFLDDARPQGFLGRIVARRLNLAGGYPADPRDWSDDDVLAYLVTQGSDTLGNWVVGDAMLTAVLEAEEPQPIQVSDRAVAYLERTNAVMQGQQVGSSAAGEQPKFTAWLRREDRVVAVLVKFSPPTDTPSGRRWSDLLGAERLAAEVLAAHGDDAPTGEILDASHRRFLEGERFDRVGTRGRRGVITLQALEAGLIAEPAPDWPAVATALQHGGLITAADASRLRRRWCFGRMIANTDMHLGNASLWFGETAPLSLAPSYDMVPMQFAPSLQGEIVPREFRLAPPLPGLRADWEIARPWALEFWQRVEDDVRISDEFRRLAVDCRREVERVGA